MADYGEAIRLRPYLAESYFNRGTAYGEFGQLQRAIEDLTEAIRLKPDYAEACFNLGVVYGKLGQYQHAIENFSKAIRLDPNSDGAYKSRGVAYFLQGNNNLGCHDAQKICESGDCQLLEFAKGKGACR
jgi:tetratricopeptide (TPR) repeat protein